MTFNHKIWITGSSRTGKTSRLVTLFQDWITTGKLPSFKNSSFQYHSSSVLVFAANDDNRHNLADYLISATQGVYPLRVKTPLGFFQDEVELFWTFLIDKLALKAQFPVKLRPENEQDLAANFWQDDFINYGLYDWGLNQEKLVRRILDLWQLAASGGISIDNISTILTQGILEDEITRSEMWNYLQILLQKWRWFCLDQGFLTYPLILDLYGNYLLPDRFYQQHLLRRYEAVLADDLDDYPAITGDLFRVMLQSNVPAIFTFNPDSAVRLGLSADPDYLLGLSGDFHQEQLTANSSIYIPQISQKNILESLNDLSSFTSINNQIQSIQTISRSDLLHKTADTIINSVENHLIKPEEIAIIAPGLDAIALYTFTKKLNEKGIKITPLNDQRPLIVFPEIRALLTLLCLVYRDLGLFIDKDAVAEMLVILSNKEIDQVRAGLIADHCYVPDTENPHLLSVEEYVRWDRLGYKTTAVYQHLFQWIQKRRSPQEPQILSAFIFLLDQAIQEFLWQGGNITYSKLSALRELMETAQHYGEIEKRSPLAKNHPIGRFIELLKRGTITADPYPVRKIIPENAITLSSIFQYRSARTSHKWHFWLDAGSPLWLSSGSANLFASHLFLKNWNGKTWTLADNMQTEEQRLGRILRDLTARSTEKIYLCHSDLGTNGQEQTGPLLNLIHVINTIQ